GGGGGESGGGPPATVGGGVTGETSGYILRIGTLLGLEDQLEKGAPQQCEPILVGPNTRSPRGIKQAHRDKVAEVLLESGGKSGGAASTVGRVQLSLVQANEISSRGRAGRLQLQRVLKNQWNDVTFGTRARRVDRRKACLGCGRRQRARGGGAENRQVHFRDQVGSGIAVLGWR